MKPVEMQTIDELLEILDERASGYMDWGNQREKAMGIGMRMVLEELQLFKKRNKINKS
tara:strand:- start:3711 stop:3884 length:174 start_codon:yes stop_codon:yes gene_type:complete